MKISYNWLQNYINIDLDKEKLSQILTDIGLEVEGIETFETVKGGLKGLVIGEVKTKIKHPKADKLSLTTVNIGTEKLLDIVCGASNVEAGQKVVVATIGTTLYDGDENFKIKKSKIRGEVSEGMICAEDEIGLGKSHDGIMVLDENAKVGTLAKDYFKIKTDTIFEIGLTPNRVDASSHIGVARDLIAFFKQTQDIDLQKPSIENFKIDNENYPINVKIENEKSCHRYAGLTISNVKVKESPDWLKNKLQSIGLKPINNIVDITNFVLHETGQPLHAFDAKKIKGNQVLVKNLSEGQKFTTLDKIERTLSEDDLMICNSEEGMCIAGVMGGFDSGVSEKTQNIFLESAYFNPVSVRKTAKRQALNTDSSFRFERGTDPNNVIFALKRASLLIKEIAGGEISSNIIDVYPNEIADFDVKVSYKNIFRLIGKNLKKQEIKNILLALDIKITKEDENELLLKVPAYRVDVQREVDIIEEILRIYGYNNIEMSSSVKSCLSYSPKINDTELKNKIADVLSNLSFNEIMANSLTKESYFENLESFNSENSVKILNPLSADLGVLRQTLLFSGLEAIRYNQNYKNFDLKLYEFGNAYFYEKDNQFREKKSLVPNYFEQQHLSIFITGKENVNTWEAKESQTNFYHLKKYVEMVFASLNIDIDNLKMSEKENDIFAYALNYSLKKNTLLDFGLLKTDLAKKLDITTQVYYADFNWNNLIKLAGKTPHYQPISKYPKVKRDLSLLIDKKISFDEIKKYSLQTERKLLKSVHLFDIYEGENLEKGKKSYALSFILQDENKTLTDKQIDKIMQKLIKTFEKQLGAIIR